MATLFHSFIIFSSFLLLSTVNARLPSSSPEDDAQKPYDFTDVPHSKSKILLPTEKSLDSAPRSVMNIEVDSRKYPKDSGKSSKGVTVMPASGSFAGKKRQEKEIPIMVNWRPINRHLDRMRVIRRSFPVNCRHRRSRLYGGAETRQRRSSISGEEKDAVDGDLRRYGKIISASWIDVERLMIREFRSLRFIFYRNHRKEGIGHALWRKIREFLINL